MLAFVEAQLITDRFDTSALQSSAAPWARLLVHTNIVFPCSIAIASGVFIFGRRELLAVLRHARHQPIGARTGLLLAAHFAALFVFVATTRALFEATPDSGGWWTVAFWISSGAVSVALLALAGLPARAWATLASRSTGALAIGIAAGIMAWITGQSTVVGFWHPLGNATLNSAHALLSLVVGDAVLDPDLFVIGTEGFMVKVGIGCSGYEGIGLTWIFVSVYLWLFRRSLRFPQALLLLPLGTLAVWITNLLRIVILILIGDRWSPDLAIGAFHTRAGWVLFCGVSLALITMAQRARFFHRAGRAALVEGHPLSSALPWLLPLLVLLGVRLGTSPFTSDGAGLTSLAALLGAGAIWLHRGDYGSLRWRFSWTPVLVGSLVFVVWSALSSPGTLAVEESGTRLASVGFAARFLGSALVVPIAEELAFRGYLMRRLISADVDRVKVGAWTGVSFVGSSLLFGLAHEQWILATVAGLAYALVLYRRRSLADAIVAHAVTNGLLLIHESF